MGNVPLSTHFHITERFHRSVHLERDFYTENALRWICFDGSLRVKL